MSAGPWILVRRLPESVEAEPTHLVLAGSLERNAVPEVLSLVQSSNRDGELAFSSLPTVGALQAAMRKRLAASR